MVMNGFKNEITGKVTDFASHIRISNFDNNQSPEEQPILINPDYYDSIKKNPLVKSVHIYASKPGIIKTKDAIQGIILKGTALDFDWNNFRTKITEGSTPHYSSPQNLYSILISRKLASLLHLKLNQQIAVYFVQQPPRVRKFTITGIYDTGMEEFDRTFVFCNIDVIRKLNDWTPQQAGGYEISLRHFKNLDAAAALFYHQSRFNLKVESIRDLFPQIFNWLELININVAIIIILMIAIAGANIISCLLIIILENTLLIGILQSLGAINLHIQKIFLCVSVFISAAGIFLGNILAFSIAIIQKSTGCFRLPEESYYLSLVPIHFSLPQILLLNAATLAACILFTMLPVLIISRINPASVLRFD